MAYKTAKFLTSVFTGTALLTASMAAQAGGMSQIGTLGHADRWSNFELQPRQFNRTAWPRQSGGHDLNQHPEHQQAVHGEQQRQCVQAGKHVNNNLNVQTNIDNSKRIDTNKPVSVNKNIDVNKPVSGKFTRTSTSTSLFRSTRTSTSTSLFRSTKISISTSPFRSTRTSTSTSPFRSRRTSTTRKTSISRTISTTQKYINASKNINIDKTIIINKGGGNSQSDAQAEAIAIASAFAAAMANSNSSSSAVVNFNGGNSSANSNASSVSSSSAFGYSGSGTMTGGSSYIAETPGPFAGGDLGAINVEIAPAAPAQCTFQDTTVVKRPSMPFVFQRTNMNSPPPIWFPTPGSIAAMKARSPVASPART